MCYGRAATGEKCLNHGEIGCATKESDYFRLDSLVNADNGENEKTDEEIMARFQILCQFSEECDMISSSIDDSCDSSGSNFMDGIYSIGLGFDATQGLDLQSRRLPLIKHDCTSLKKFEIAGVYFDVPGNIVPGTTQESQGSYQTYDSLDNYKKSKSDKTGVTSDSSTLSSLNDMESMAMTSEEVKKHGKSKENSKHNTKTVESSKEESTTFGVNLKAELSKDDAGASGSAGYQQTDGAGSGKTTTTGGDNKNRTSDYSPFENVGPTTSIWSFLRFFSEFVGQKKKRF